MSISDTGIPSGYGVESASYLSDAGDLPVGDTHSQVRSNVSQNIAAQSVVEAANNREGVYISENAANVYFECFLDNINSWDLSGAVYDGNMGRVNDCASLINKLPEDDRVDAVFEMIESIDCTLYRAIDANRSRTIRAYGAILNLLPQAEQVNIMTERTREYANYLYDAVKCNKNRALGAYLNLLNCITRDQSSELLNSIGLRYN